MQLGARSLEIAASHASRVAALPLLHRDSFDRILIAQAQLEDMTLISADSIFNQYEVSLLWAASSQFLSSFKIGIIPILKILATYYSD